jgi:hypothetical protein
MEATCSSKTQVDFLNGLHGVMSQETELFITAAVWTSNPTKAFIFFLCQSRIQVRWSPKFGHEPSEVYSHGSDLIVVRCRGSSSSSSSSSSWMALQPLWALASFQFPDLFKISRTPWTGDQPSPGLYFNTGQHKQNKNIYTPYIHALSGIRTHDHSVRASEDSSCLRSLGYRDRPMYRLRYSN